MSEWNNPVVKMPDPGVEVIVWIKGERKPKHGYLHKFDKNLIQLKACDLTIHKTCINGWKKADELPVSK